MKDKLKLKTISVLLYEDDIEVIRKQAKQSSRTVSQQIRFIVEKHIESPKNQKSNNLFYEREENK